LQPNGAGADAAFIAASSILVFWPVTRYQRALLSARSRVKCPLPDIALACPAKRAQRIDSFPDVALDGLVTRENIQRYRRFAGESTDSAERPQITELLAGNEAKFKLEASRRDDAPE
jgi:hypothetical protein